MRLIRARRNASGKTGRAFGCCSYKSRGIYVKLWDIPHTRVRLTRSTGKAMFSGPWNHCCRVIGRIDLNHAQNHSRILAASTVPDETSDVI